MQNAPVEKIEAQTYSLSCQEKFSSFYAYNHKVEFSRRREAGAQWSS